MKFLTSAIVLTLLQGAATAEDSDCKEDGVTNKATCDTWCGSVGAFESSINANPGGVKGLTGWSCDCNADFITNSTSDKSCTATFDFEDDAQDCAEEGVRDKESCDDYCGEVGSYTAYTSEGNTFRIECICGPATNEYEKHCISNLEGSTASNINLGVTGVVAVAGVINAVAYLV